MASGGYITEIQYNTYDFTESVTLVWAPKDNRLFFFDFRPPLEIDTYHGCCSYKCGVEFGLSREKKWDGPPKGKYENGIKCDLD